jgi:hypothetical protein
VKTWKRWSITIAVVAALGFAYWKFAIPTHRVEMRSELVMLGDLDGDHKWTGADLTALDGFLQGPFTAPDPLACRLDLNRNGLIDGEDLAIVRTLVAAGGDPYAAQEAALAQGQTFPRPREIYRYITLAQYRPRPLFALPHAFDKEIGADCLASLAPPTCATSYGDALQADIYAEAVRFDEAWRKRQPTLLPMEREYARMKLARLQSLCAAGERFEFLLALMDLVEDAETLTARGQSGFPTKMLAFRDHLREILHSPLYADFKAGKQDWRAVLNPVSAYLKSDLGLIYNLETLGPPRSLTHLQNYLDRAEWQYYKSATREDDFRALIEYAQHDPRYLRAVSRTSRKMRDLSVENHNLPMVLLFREALRIKGGDKKKAIGLLDESIRIPYGWIRSIPRESLPGALALDNFLLPGNKEDGADKSRHWNVFGGICIYKSPQEAMDLALKREMQDLRDDRYSEEAMREFFRDMISNLNGMYHVMTVNPDLLAH